MRLVKQEKAAPARPLVTATHSDYTEGPVTERQITLALCPTVQFDRANNVWRTSVDHFLGLKESLQTDQTYIMDSEDVMAPTYESEIIGRKWKQFLEHPFQFRDVIVNSTAAAQRETGTSNPAGVHRSLISRLASDVRARFDRELTHPRRSDLSSYYDIKVYPQKLPVAPNVHGRYYGSYDYDSPSDNGIPEDKQRTRALKQAQWPLHAYFGPGSPWSIRSFCQNTIEEVHCTSSLEPMYVVFTLKPSASSAQNRFSVTMVHCLYTMDPLTAQEGSPQAVLPGLVKSALSEAVRAYETDSLRDRLHEVLVQQGQKGESLPAQAPLHMCSVLRTQIQDRIARDSMKDGEVDYLLENDCEFVYCSPEAFEQLKGEAGQGEYPTFMSLLEEKGAIGEDKTLTGTLNDDLQSVQSETVTLAPESFRGGSTAGRSSPDFDF